jgi:hypothetical protein
MLVFLLFVVATIVFAIESIMTRALIAIGLTVLSLAFVFQTWPGGVG